MKETKKEKCEKHFKSVIDKYENNVNNEYKKKAKKLELIVKNFIKSKELILYGGTALDLLLPKNKKIYNDDKLFDYDVYSCNAINDGKELVKLLIENNFKYVQLRQAMFTNDTFKIFVENLGACDITMISKEEYNKLKSVAYIRKNMLIIAPHILLAYMCMELSQPQLAYYRWSKVYDRHIILNKEYGINTIKNLTLNTIIPHTNIEKLLTESLLFFKKNKLPLLGYHALKIIQGKNINKFSIFDNEMSYISCASTDISIVINFYKKKLDITVQSYKYFTRIKHDNINICDIYDASNICISICKISGYSIVSLFGMKYYLYLQLIDCIYEKEKCDYIKYYIYIVNNLMNKFNCKTNCMVNLECYGNGKSNMWEIRKMRWDKGIIKYKPMNGNSKANTVFNT
jgi:hypothetical protein